MATGKFKILVIESSSSVKALLEDAVKAADSKTSAHLSFAQDIAAGYEMLSHDAVDMLLIPTQQSSQDKQTSPINAVSLLTAASEKGLSVQILCQPGAPEITPWYIGALRFGIHKNVLRILGALGRWWSLREQDQDTPEVYRKLLNRISDGVAEVDVDDTIRWANTALQRSLGDVNLRGVSIEQIIKPSDVHQLRTIRQQLDSGVVIPFPVRLATGQMVELDPTVRFGQDGKQVGSSIVFRGVRSNQESERGRELFTLYSVATALSQASSLEQASTSVLTRIMELLDLAAGGIHLSRDDRRFTHGLSLDSPGREAMAHLGEKVRDKGRAVVHRELPVDESTHFDVLSKGGIRGVAVIPLQSQGEFLGSLWFLSTDPGHFSREVVSLLISISVQLVVALENFRHTEERLKEEANRRQFYRDALAAVTHGKLHLLESPELEETWSQSGPALGERAIRSYADVPEMRKFVEQTLLGQGFTEEKAHDMALCATEAAGNVIKHAEYGWVRIRGDADVVRICIEDRGPGIHFSNLPSAVLKAGFSTAPSLGMGYSILLEMADAVFLSTGEHGTSVILEVTSKVIDPLEAFAGLDLL